MRERLTAFGREFVRAVQAPFRSWQGIVAGATISLVMYFVMMWGTYPLYFEQLVGADIFYLDDAIITLTQYTYGVAGAMGLFLTVVYALLTGIAVTNIGFQLRTMGLSSLKGGSALVPGILASGCASCGVGLLSIVGLTGLVTVLPFQGNSLRLAGVILLIYLLGRTGDPRTCSL